MGPRGEGSQQRKKEKQQNEVEEHLKIPKSNGKTLEFSRALASSLCVSTPTQM